MSLPMEAPRLKLYSYCRSSSSHRVRIALNLKGLEYEYKAVNLSKNEQSSPEFEKVNPIKCVPALVDGDFVVADSFAIILYLEEKYPEYSLLPEDLQKKTLNLQIASIVSSSIHPLSNLRALNFLGQTITSDEKVALAQFHIVKGFTALEMLLKCSAGRYATGDKIQLGEGLRANGRLILLVLFLNCKITPLPLISATACLLPPFVRHEKKADVFLAPQILKGTRRFQIDMSPFPTLARLGEAYCELPAFQAALPERQPDADT